MRLGQFVPLDSPNPFPPWNRFGDPAGYFEKSPFGSADSMISIHDTPDVVKRKINKAFCPEKQIKGNPVLDLCKLVVFPELDGEFFIVERPEKFGGNLEFKSFIELEENFSKDLHPLDLKNSTVKYINKILEPIHEYFNKKPENYTKMKELGIIL